MSTSIQFEELTQKREVELFRWVLQTYRKRPRSDFDGDEAGLEFWDYLQDDENLDTWIAEKITAHTQIKKEKYDTKVRQAKKELTPSGELQTQILTLSIDKNLKEEKVVELCNAFTEHFFNSRLKCIEEPILRYEFYSSTGWNPHIHIFTYKLTTNGKLATRIRQTIKNKFPDIYRVEAVAGKEQNQAQYLMGIKKEEKTEFLELDNIFREKYNLKEYYNGI